MDEANAGDNAEEAADDVDEADNATDNLDDAANADAADNDDATDDDSAVGNDEDLRTVGTRRRGQKARIVRTSDVVVTSQNKK